MNTKRLIIKLRDDLKDKDFVLLFAYNGTGKTRISMEFKEKGKKIEKDSRDTLYFNAFTEDLFHWDNDLKENTKRYLMINEQSKFFTGLKELELEGKISNYLNQYTDFNFSIDYDDWKITFFKDIIEKNKTKRVENIKVSRGEENIFIWCFFLVIAKLAIEGDNAYNWVKYIYIDDPISSLDDNNVIAVAADLASLLKSNEKRVKTVISSHHSLFFNVMANELKKEKYKKYFFHRDKKSNEYTLQSTNKTPFFNHISMLNELKQAVNSNKIYTYHFNMLRNILEKTSTFFGFDNFSNCICGIEDKVLYSRALNLLSHGNHSIYEPREMVDDNKKLFKKIFLEFQNRYKFKLQDEVKRKTPLTKEREI